MRKASILAASTAARDLKVPPAEAASSRIRLLISSMASRNEAWLGRGRRAGRTVASRSCKELAAAAILLTLPPLWMIHMLPS